MQSDIVSQQGQGSDSVLRFAVFPYQFCLPATQVVAIITPPRLTILPMSGADIAGVFMHQGALATCIDLRRKFSLPPREDKTSGQMLLGRDGETLLAFWVDEVSDIVNCDTMERRPLPALQSHGQVFTGCYLSDQDIILETSVEQMYHGDRIAVSACLQALVSQQVDEQSRKQASNLDNGQANNQAAILAGSLNNNAANESLVGNTDGLIAASDAVDEITVDSSGLQSESSSSDVVVDSVDGSLDEVCKPVSESGAVGEMRPESTPESALESAAEAGPTVQPESAVVIDADADMSDHYALAMVALADDVLSTDTDEAVNGVNPTGDEIPAAVRDEGLTSDDEAGWSDDSLAETKGQYTPAFTGDSVDAVTDDTALAEECSPVPDSGSDIESESVVGLGALAAPVTEQAAGVEPDEINAEPQDRDDLEVGGEVVAAPELDVLDDGHDAEAALAQINIVADVDCVDTGPSVQDESAPANIVVESADSEVSGSDISRSESVATEVIGTGGIEPEAHAPESLVSESRLSEPVIVRVTPPADFVDTSLNDNAASSGMSAVSDVPASGAVLDSSGGISGGSKLPWILGGTGLMVALFMLYWLWPTATDERQRVNNGLPDAAISKMSPSTQPTQSRLREVLRIEDDKLLLRVERSTNMTPQHEASVDVIAPLVTGMSEADPVASSQGMVQHQQPALPQVMQDMDAAKSSAVEQVDVLLPSTRSQVSLEVNGAPSSQSAGSGMEVNVTIVRHVVIRGDTLWHIAKGYLGNPYRYPQLARLSQIKNPDLIYPGDIVTIEYSE